MANELIIPNVTITNTPTGVIVVSPPPPVQSVVVGGSVAIVQPVLVDQGSAGTSPWPVTGTFTFVPTPSTTAIVTAVTVTTSPTVLLVSSLLRKGFAVQNTTDIIFVKLDSTAATNLYSYELPKKGILEIENYCGPVTAVSPSGSIVVFVTEKV